MEKYLAERNRIKSRIAELYNNPTLSSLEELARLSKKLEMYESLAEEDNDRKLKKAIDLIESKFSGDKTYITITYRVSGSVVHVIQKSGYYYVIKNRTEVVGLFSDVVALAKFLLVSEDLFI